MLTPHVKCILGHGAEYEYADDKVTTDTIVESLP